MILKNKPRKRCGNTSICIFKFIVTYEALLTNINLINSFNLISIAFHCTNSNCYYTLHIKERQLKIKKNKSSNRLETFLHWKVRLIVKVALPFKLGALYTWQKFIYRNKDTLFSIFNYFGD